MAKRLRMGVWLVMTAWTAWAADGSQETVKFADRVSFDGLFYLAYDVTDEDGATDNGVSINRAYLTARVKILPFLSGRITYDTTQDKEGDGLGDMEVRLKYAYAQFDLGDWGVARDLSLEAGIVHMTWLDFEEHVNLYRMRDPMFIERSGVFNSADFGVTFAGMIGPPMPDAYRKKVNPKYAGRFGSFALGIYNGGGYHSDEANDDKVKEARVTVRPAPDQLPGLQVSCLAITGKGNQPGPRQALPDWDTFDAMLSYECEKCVITLQYVTGTGNQKGTWTQPDDPSQSTDFDGTAVFGEWRFGPHWRAIGGYDRFHRESTNQDSGFTRGFAGIGYDFGKHNVLIFDYDRRDYDDPNLNAASRFQLTMQLKF